MIAKTLLVDTVCTNCHESLVDRPGAIVHDDSGNAYCSHGCRGEALETLAHWREESELVPVYSD